MSDKMTKTRMKQLVRESRSTLSDIVMLAQLLERDSATASKEALYQDLAECLNVLDGNTALLREALIPTNWDDA